MLLGDFFIIAFIAFCNAGVAVYFKPSPPPTAGTEFFPTLISKPSAVPFKDNLCLVISSISVSALEKSRAGQLLRVRIRAIAGASFLPSVTALRTYFAHTV